MSITPTLPEATQVAADEWLSRPMRRAWMLAVALTLFVVLLAALPPFVGLPWRAILWAGFDRLCHQLPERSFAVDGVEFAVCHRCFGTYVGLLLGAVLMPALRSWDAWLNRHAGPVLVASLLVPSMDWGLQVAGLWTNTADSRSLSGAVFGVAAGYFFARALAVAARQRRLAASPS